MNEDIKKLILEGIKDVKIQKGAILSKQFIEEHKEEIKAMSDDDLLLRANGVFGQFCMLLANQNDVMKAYAFAVAYFVMELEAQERELYW